MTEAKIHPIKTPSYNSNLYPPMPPRIRLAAVCWERVWWLTFRDPIEQTSQLQSIIKRFETQKVNLRAQMRTHRRVCFAITTMEIDEQIEFEITMTIMAALNQELGVIEKVEDRAVSMWPIDYF